MNADARGIEPDPNQSTNSAADCELDPLDELAAEFLDRLRRGERPTVREFLARAPDRARELGDLLSALLLVEDAKPPADATYATAAGLSDGAHVLERIGDFRVLRELGRGGMGIVYEAEQESLGRHVALKVLAQNPSRSPQVIQRFLREARAAAQLHHTNIVPVFGVDKQDGLYYYAMQFIRGLSLDKVLDEVRRLKARTSVAAATDATSTGVSDTSIGQSLVAGQFAHTPKPVPSSSASAEHPALAAVTDSDARYFRGVARIGLQVAEALEYAHQQGTLHRDIKPSNILLDVQGVAWVTDFGLAKAVEDEDLTRTGDLVGTIRYMAPERFRGRCDGRSDLYGLGLTLYELLALRPAFESSDRENLLFQVNQFDPPRLRGINPAIPEDLETIVHKAIEKEADHRYARTADLADDLKCFLEDRPIAARRVSSTERLTRWARRNPGLATLGCALAGMLALIVAVIVVADVRLRRQHQQTTRNLERAESAETDAVSKLLDSYVANARAGRRSRFAGQRFEGLQAIESAARLDRHGSQLLALRNEAIACLALPDIRPARSWENGPVGGFLGVDFDPISGRMARCTPAGDVVIRSADGHGAEIRLRGNGVRAVMVRFSRDGRHLAVKHEDRGRVVLAVWDCEQSAKLLEVPDGVQADAVDFHPDGRTFASANRDGAIVLYDLRERREIRRFAPGPAPQTIRFDPSGTRIAAAHRNARDGVQIRNVADGSIAASWALGESQYSVSWHPDGRLLASGDEIGRIQLLDSMDPSSAPRTIFAHDGVAVSLAFHPQGRILASASWDGSLRLWDVFSMKQLVECPLADARPLRFSDDGRFLGPALEGAAAWTWEVAEGIECRSLGGASSGASWLWNVDFLARGGVVASAGDDGLNLALSRGGQSAFVALPGTRGIAAAPDGSFLITSGTTGLLRWPVSISATGDVRVGAPGLLGPLAGIPTGRVRLSRDGQVLAVVVDSEIGRVVVLDLTGRRAPVTLTGHVNLERMDLSADGDRVATGTWRGTGVKVWNARMGTLTRELPVNESADVFFSPDGKSLVTASGEEFAVWDVDSWEKRISIRRNLATGLPGKAAFSPDGRLLAITTSRTLVQLIDPASGRKLASLESRDQQNVAALNFNDDGRMLAVAFSAAGVQLWDLGAIQRALAKIGLEWTTDAAAARPSSALTRISIEPANWQAPLATGTALARMGRWSEAGRTFDEAIASGARHLGAHTQRILLRRARGDDRGYREACREVLRQFDSPDLPPLVAHDIAWACALGPDAAEDFTRVIHLAERAASAQPAAHRLNTLGAVLFRAGRFEAAIGQLLRSVQAHGGNGSPYDAFFLAMAYQQLGQTNEARQWLKRGTSAEPPANREFNAAADASWYSTLELGILGREASALIEAKSP